MSRASTDVVRELYEAFGRADIPTILSALDEDVDWRSPESLPHGGDFHGREAVGRFFEVLGETWDGLQVDVEDIVGNDELVVVLISARGRLRATGEETSFTAAHAWTLREGTPVRFAEYVDAPASLPAAQPVST